VADHWSDDLFVPYALGWRHGPQALRALRASPAPHGRRKRPPHPLSHGVEVTHPLHRWLGEFAPASRERGCGGRLRLPWGVGTECLHL
jgi:hypothetical protein